MTNTPPFEILVVCTGNICRSPAAEQLLRAALDDSVRVTSAGTHGLVGEPMDPQMVARMPMSCTGFAATQLTPARVRTAGLVLGLTRAHRSRIVETVPAAVRRTFTVREFARILSLPDAFSPAETVGAFLAEAVPRAAALRTQVRVQVAEDDDISDPYGQSDSVFADCFTEIEAAVRLLADSCRVTAAASQVRSENPSQEVP